VQTESVTGASTATEVVTGIENTTTNDDVTVDVAVIAM
jgi:hypothetical protein